jgi:hypothetical protein
LAVGSGRPIIVVMARRSHSTDKAPVGANDDAHRDREPNARAALSRRMRVLLSVILLYHALAVFVGAWNSAPPPSPLAITAAIPFRPYITLLDLNHGYRFFAPDPGPSHLFYYTLTLREGTTQSGHFPNREEHWPRLLYHRYFMLSEQANGFLPGGPTPVGPMTIPPEAYSRFESLANSYAAHLLKINDGTRIHWRLVRHSIPQADEVAKGQSLTDEGLYETLRSGTLLRDEAAEEVQ